jgi:hypothetical protein
LTEYTNQYIDRILENNSYIYVLVDPNKNSSY